MKIKTTILILMTIFMIACSSTKKKIAIEDVKFDKYYFKEKNIPIVKGKIFNLTNEEIEKVKIRYSLITPFALNQSYVDKSGELNADGTFELEIDNAFPYQYISIHVGKLFRAGIYANSDLYIELDADTLREKSSYMNEAGVKYLGTDGEINTLLNKHVLYKKNEQLNIAKAILAVRRDRDLNYESFLSKHDSLYTILHNIDDEFIHKNPSTTSFLIKNERLSDYYADICSKHWDTKSPQISKDLFERIKNHKPYVASYKCSRFYSHFSTYLESRAQKKYNSLSLDKFSGYSKLSVSEKENMVEYSHIKTQSRKGIPYDKIRLNELSRILYPILKDSITTFRTLITTSYLDSLFIDNKADLLKLKLSSKDANENKIILETALTTMNTNWCKKALELNYEENSKKIATIERILKEEKSNTTDKKIGESISELPSGAKLYKVDNLSAEELLSNIKAEFNNKALILDFWATWCGPCLQDMPYSKKLHHKFKNDPVEFVYLCTSAGSDIEKWKAKIIELEMSGTHLFVESSIESELMQLFSFNGFPSYAFIDKNGNYKAGAIRRMSDLKNEELQKLIEEE